MRRAVFRSMVEVSWSRRWGYRGLCLVVSEQGLLGQRVLVPGGRGPGFGRVEGIWLKVLNLTG